MRKLPLVILSLLLLAVIAGCSESPASRQLDQADAIIEDNPDSALAIVRSIPDSALSDPDDRALRALLLTQALTKTYVPITSDSLITLAVDRYRDGDRRRYMKSLFYRGDIRHSAARYPDAMRDAMRAHDLAVDLDDPYWRAKTAELMGFIFSDTHLHKEAANCDLEAANYYKTAGKNLNHLYSLCDYAISLGNLGNHKQCVIILDSILEQAETIHHNNGLVDYCLNNMYSNIYFLEDSNYANWAKEKVCNNGIDLNNSAHLNNYNALYQLKEGNLDSAFTCISRANAINTSPREQALIFKLFSDYYFRTNDLQKSKIYLDSALYVQNKETDNLLEQSVMHVQKEILSENLDTQKVQEHSFRRNLLISFVILGCSLFIVLIYIKSKYTIKKIKEDSKISDYLSVSEEFKILLPDENSLNSHNESELDEESSENKDYINNYIPSKSIELLFREKWDLLNLLCNQYFEYGRDSENRTRILNEIYAEITKMRSPKNLKKIEESVNQYMDNVITIIRQECTFLKPGDITFLTLIISGFSAKAVCFFTDISLTNFYAKRSRLIKRIKESGPENLCLILSKFP